MDRVRCLRFLNLISKVSEGGLMTLRSLNKLGHLGLKGGAGLARERLLRRDGRRWFSRRFCLGVG